RSVRRSVRPAKRCPCRHGQSGIPVCKRLGLDRLVPGYPVVARNVSRGTVPARERGALLGVFRVVAQELGLHHGAWPTSFRVPLLLSRGLRPTVDSAFSIVQVSTSTSILHPTDR